MNPRKVAYEILKNVFMHEGYAGLLLRNSLNELNDKDKGLVTEIVYGTIRNYRLLEYQYRDFVKKISKEDKILLNMSVYQLFMMDKIPDYAIVKESVNLSKKKAFINAVLRKVINHGFKMSEDLGVKYSLPDFIVNLWIAHYGKEKAVLIMDNLLKESVVYGRINSLKISKSEMEKDNRVNFIDEICFKYEGDLIRSEYFKKGEVIIQDYSSQQVCMYLDLKDNLKVLDLCSAPGSKTSQIAMAMDNTGEILAVDLHEHRVKLIENLNKTLGITNVKCLVSDARKIDNNLKFDRILVDAPCSGLGVLKGKADIKVKIKPEDLDEIVTVQKEILHSCADKLKINGILVYSTCTLNKKENEKQIELFIKNNPNYVLLEERCILPFEFDSDGFYIAKLIRKE